VPLVRFSLHVVFVYKKYIIDNHGKSNDICSCRIIIIIIIIIGQACAKLAHVYGMKIIALRRNPKLSINDPLCSYVYGTDKASLNQLMSESDYIVCSAPSTIETQGMVNADAFAAVKDDAVFINLGRGPVVDEDALIHALKSGKLKGAALDVFKEEPLPKENELWDLDNILISPHNMDQTNTFMHGKKKKE
jgi:phosphoglycerate dehydrogenase-like enzyme